MYLLQRLWASRQRRPSPPCPECERLKVLLAECERQRDAAEAARRLLTSALLRERKDLPNGQE